MISADSHVIEPPDLWDRVDAEFREHAPQLVSDPDADWMYFNGVRMVSFTLGAQVGKRFQGLEHLKPSGRWADVPPAAYEPRAYLEENETDGVYGAVVYPSFGFVMYAAVQDPALLAAFTRACNDWMGDFCSEDTRRLKGIALLAVDDIDVGVAELVRAKKLGFAGAMIPMDKPSYDDPALDPLWATAQELGMPLSVHTGGRRIQVGAFDKAHSAKAIVRVTSDYSPRKALGEMLFSGVFERFPALQVGAVEFEAAWVPHFLRRLDDTYTQNWLGNEVHRYSDGRLPSDVFHSNVFVTFEEDDLALQHREMIGMDGLMWSNDYPHTESTFPRSREIVDEMMRELPDDDVRRLTYANAVELYDFVEPPVLAAQASTGGR